MNESGKALFRKRGRSLLWIPVWTILSLLVFAAIAKELNESEMLHMDGRIIGWLAPMNQSHAIGFMKMVTHLGSVEWISVCLLALTAWLLVRQRSVAAAWLLMVMGLTGLLTTLFKQTFRRIRPGMDPAVDGVGYSFPSAHASAVMAFYGFVIYLLFKSRAFSMRQKTWAAGLLTLIIGIVGMSRILLKVHFPSDVVAGYSLGMFCLSLGILGMEIHGERTGIPYREKVDA
ncbi:phosphatase PAP2 family protein [Staphylospora marina]|uniref:phosphatase PAP2 family protein n=1 Tax=Staphylospora marina TaxID=2490858 RepID=UPI000F5BDB76|nr:phosphatase PAP2 family protein [Staphylospora marina]